MSSPSLHTPFGFVSEAHSFGADVARFRDAIARRAREDGWRMPGADAGPTVHAEIKAVPALGGAWTLDRFYWSRQEHDERAAGALAADTLSYAAKSGTLEWLRFPQDPYLVHMADYFAVEGRAAGARVLRYVPLRRTTFRVTGGDGRPRIGKFKRRSRFREAYELLGTVHATVNAARVPFAVAAPLGVDEARCLYFQDILAGENVADTLTEASAAGLLAEIGGLHAAMHAMPAGRLATRGNGIWLRGARESLALVSLYDADAGRRLAPAIDVLARTVPPDAPADFCHGDFVCSQLLRAGADWSITDFDLCHAGDRHRDAAMFLAALPFDVALLAPAAGRATCGSLLERCEAAYLAGYRGARKRPLDPARLAWHRACAELYFMALGLKKDRHCARDVARRAGLVLGLAGQEGMRA